MDKNSLVRFINKYYLDGVGNAVVLNSNSEKQQLMTKSVSEGNSMLALVKMTDWKPDFDDSILGVYSTDSLLSMIKVLDNDVKISVLKSDEKALALKFNDSNTSVNYMLSDPSIINEPPNLKNIPEFELNVNITEYLRKTFLAGKGALPEVTKFSVVTDGTSAKLVLGFSASTNTNRITIPVETTQSAHMETMSFNAEHFASILKANEECETGTMEVSSDGLIKMSFKVDTYESPYWLVATQDVD